MKMKTQKWPLSSLINKSCGLKIEEKYANLEILGVAIDSRKVGAGYLFAAFKGEKVDGKSFIPKAIDAGAVAILCEDDVELPDGVCLIKCDNARKVFSHIAGTFYDNQPEVIAAVTGTNGKTSIVHFCREIWKRVGKHAASIGTVGIEDSDGKFDYDRSNFLTTPDPVKLHDIIEKLAEKGVTNLAIEASSHGLTQYRPDGIKVNIAAFTNLTRDHLDYHGTFEKYLEAKSRLFSEVLRENGVAVLNADIEQYKYLKDICDKKGHKVVTYGAFKEGCKLDVEIYKISPLSEGMQISFSVVGKVYDIKTPLVGEFQAYNLLCALAIVMSSGSNADEIVDVLPEIPCVLGRMQKVEGVNVYVDYAHTPDALEKAIKVLHPHTSGKLWVVFGCGGDRDKGKRPQMGKIACENADYVIVTDDNPRTENPESIRSEIMAACGDNAKEIGDRQKAIEYAMSNMAKDDVLLVAGKGHEKTQTIGDKVLPFDDVEVVGRLR